MVQSIRLGLALLFGLAAPALATAPAQPLPPLRDFARAPAFQAAQLSPNGRSVATIEMLDGRGAIYLRGLANGSRILVYRNPERSIGNIAWSNDGRYLLSLQDSGGDEGYHLFRLDPRGGASPVDLTPFKGVQVDLIRTSGQRSGPLLIGMNRRDPAYSDVFAVDVASARLTSVLQNPGRFTDFFADARGSVGAAAAITAKGELELWSVRGAPDRWHRRYVAGVGERFKPLAMASDGNSLLALSDRGQATQRLVRIGLADGAVAAVPGGKRCAGFDIGDAVVGARVIDAITCTTLQSEIVARDRSLAVAVGAARRLLGSDANLTLESRSADGRTIMLFGDKGDRPGRFVLVQPERSARVYADTRPWLAGAALARPRAFWLTARDGLRLLTYVTRPAGATAPGPAVIAIHGGPWTRDTGGYEGETQLLASRGYTVIQVNFRGSTGLGRKTFEGGVREFGGRMSDDLDDAYRWAVGQRLVDKDRVCLLGGSYGGFATLAELTRPTPYRCGIDYAGPVDLETLMKAFPPSWKPFLPRSWYRFVGDPGIPAQVAAMRARSPIYSVDRIRAPLLIFQGANDPRVTQIQSDRIVCSLRRRGIMVDYLLAGNEGHSFGNEETGLAVSRALELFLARHLGGSAQPAVDAPVDAALAAFRAAGNAIHCP